VRFAGVTSPPLLGNLYRGVEESPLGSREEQREVNDEFEW
jgi:hypothetical protein